jgi:SSS family solute:Na+ symporter
MVPAAGILVGICPLVARNVVRVSSERGQYRTNQITVVVLTGLALALALFRPDSLANLLLLTFSGLSQLAPATAAALFGARTLISATSAIAGTVVGVAVVIVQTFSPVLSLGHLSPGLAGLAVNIVVIAGLEAARRMRAPAPAPAAEAVEGV